MPKTYLFFPIEVGIAHMVRSYAVVSELARRGHKVIFALPKRKQHLFGNATGVEIVDTQCYVADDFTLKVSELTNYDFVKKMVADELTIIKKHKPDAIVVDFRISALVASRVAGCKTYLISNGDALPYSSYLPNPGFPKLIYKVSLPVVQKVLDIGTRRYLEPLRRVLKEYGIETTFDDWFRSVEYIVPESKHFLLPVAKDLKIYHVGPLFWNKFGAVLPDWLEGISPDGNTIYITFGGTGFDREKLRSLAIALVDAGFRVVVTTGSICDPSEFEPKRNLFVARYLPGDKVCEKVDFVICHGGYGTMMDAVKNSKPIIAIPFNPDQIIHGTRMEELGVCRCLVKLGMVDVVKIFTLDWKWIEDKGKRVSIGEVINEAKKMSKNLSSYHHALADFNARYPCPSGAHEAADIVEKDI